MVGQRRNVCDLRITDGNVGEWSIDTHVLVLADRDGDRHRPVGSADLQLPLCLRVLHRRQQERRSRDHCRRQRGEAAMCFQPGLAETSAGLSCAP